MFKAITESKPAVLIINLLNSLRNRTRRMYSWMMNWAETKHASKALAGFSFMEGSFFPIPPDPLLITMTTVRPHKYLNFAFICTIASVFGGLFGYFIGLSLFETVGKGIVDFYKLQEGFVSVGQSYHSNAFLTILTAAFTPVPYKLIAITAGVFKVDIPVFIVASVLGRGARFFMVAFFMHHFGKRYKDKIEKYVNILSIIFILLLILGVLAVRYIF